MNYLNEAEKSLPWTAVAIAVLVIVVSSSSSLRRMVTAYASRLYLNAVVVAPNRKSGQAGSSSETGSNEGTVSGLFYYPGKCDALPSI